MSKLVKAADENAIFLADMKRTRRRRKLRWDAQKRDIYYYFTDLVRSAGNRKQGEVYNVAACFASVFTGLDWRAKKSKESQL